MPESVVKLYQMNRKLEILQELISIGVIVSEPTLVDGQYVFPVDIGFCTDEKRMIELLDELKSLKGD